MNVIDLRKSDVRKHHPTSPSSIPALLQCALYRSGEESTDDNEKGTLMHDYAQDIVAGKVPNPTGLEMIDREDCAWASEEVKYLFSENAPESDCTIEEYLEVRDGSDKIITAGFADFNGFNIVADLKGGLDFRPDLHYHEPQLRMYALAKMQKNNIDRVLCAEIYMKSRKVRKYWATRTECEVTIAAALKRRNNPEAYPVINDYCHYCARLQWCPAVNKIFLRTAELLAAAMGNLDMIAVPEKIECGIVMSQMLTIWKKVVKPFGESIEKAALDLVDRTKSDIPYYIKEKTHGRATVRDVLKAFDRVPVSPEEFASAMTLSTSKLSEILAQKQGIGVKEARSIIDGLLEDLIVFGESNDTLKPLLHNQNRKRTKKAE